MTLSNQGCKNKKLTAINVNQTLSREYFKTNKKKKCYCTLKLYYTLPRSLFFNSALGGFVPNQMENKAFLNSSPATTPL